MDVSGTKVLPNWIGIYANGAGGIIKGNVIAGNSSTGIVAQAFVDGMTIQGNWIGTDEAETLNLGNGLCSAPESTFTGSTGSSAGRRLARATSSRTTAASTAA